MASLGPILVMDTSIVLELLNVPKHNEHHKQVARDFERYVGRKATFVLPMAAIAEVGNHIADLPNGDDRRRAARRFVTAIREAIDGEAPWQPARFPDARDILDWLDGFPDGASRGEGFSDQSIIQEWHRQCLLHPLSHVKVWAQDQKLVGYDREP